MVNAKLYKKTSTGAIQVWWQEQQSNKYRTHCGQLNGKIVVSKWTVCQGKNIGRSNETSPSDQAAREVASNYDKKRKAGYSDNLMKTRRSDLFRPMLAKSYDDYKDRLFKDDSSVWVQPKLDGIRCIATSSGLFSRAGNQIVAVPHIWEALEPLFEKYPGLILDGELYTHELKADFNRIVSLVKKLKPTDSDLVESAKTIQYWMYDSPGEDEYARRMNRVIQAAKRSKSLIAVPTHAVASFDEIDALYTQFLSEDYEGQMIRIDGPYEQKRSARLLKRKTFIDQEFVVLDIEEGKGNRSGMAGCATLQLHKEKTFRANIVGDRAYLKKVLAYREDLVGKKATVEYFALTPDGVPRFPRVKVFHDTPRW